MRRLGGILFRLLWPLSAALLLAALGLAIVGQFGLFGFHYEFDGGSPTGCREAAMVCSRNDLRLWSVDMGGGGDARAKPRAGLRWFHRPPQRGELDFSWSPRWSNRFWDWLGFRVYIPPPLMPPKISRDLSATFPHYALILLFAPLPLLRGRRWLRDRRVRRRVREGRCIHCGYDLRASRARCPECGADIADAPAGA